MRPPYHLRLEMEDGHGVTVLTVDGAGFSPQEAFDDATSFLHMASDGKGPRPVEVPDVEAQQ